MITVVCGTNRPDANSEVIGNLYVTKLTALGENAHLLNLKDLPSDFVTSALYDNAGKNEAFNPFREAMANAHKFIFVVPEYNGSFPGVLKAFIDGLKYPVTFRGKKAAMLGLSSGIQGAGLALSHLTDILNYCGTHVLAFKPKFPHIDEHLKNGEITNKKYLDEIDIQLKQFVDF